MEPVTPPSRDDDAATTREETAVSGLLSGLGDPGPAPARLRRRIQASLLDEAVTSASRVSHVGDDVSDDRDRRHAGDEVPRRRAPRARSIVAATAVSCGLSVLVGLGVGGAIPASVRAAASSGPLGTIAAVAAHLTAAAPRPSDLPWREPHRQ